MGEDLVDAFLVNICDHTCCSIFLISCFNISKLNKVMLRISCFFKGIQKKLLCCKIAKCLSWLFLVKHSAVNNFVAANVHYALLLLVRSVICITSILL